MTSLLGSVVNLSNMKALRYYGRKDMRMEEVPIPEPADDEALLRIMYASICQTDVERWWHGPTMARWRTKSKTVGHETAGRVEAIGSNVRGLSVGDRVMVNNIRPCGECFWCIRGSQSSCSDVKSAGFALDGGLAEFMIWPESHLIKLPDNIPDVQTPLIEPTSVAVHAARNTGVKVGDTVAVIGCGTVGMLTMQVVRAAGARVIAGDLREQSLGLARKLGAYATVNTGDPDALDQVLALTGGVGADIVVETAGAVVTPRIAINWTRPRRYDGAGRYPLRGSRIRFQRDRRNRKNGQRLCRRVAGRYGEGDRTNRGRQNRSR